MKLKLDMRNRVKTDVKKNQKPTKQKKASTICGETCPSVVHITDISKYIYTPINGTLLVNKYKH